MMLMQMVAPPEMPNTGLAAYQPSVWMGVEESVKVWEDKASVASYLHFTHDPEHSGNNHITSQG